MEVWILLFTVWALQADGDFKAQEERAEFPTARECANDGQKRMSVATEANQPAIFFCFKKCEKIG